MNIDFTLLTVGPTHTQIIEKGFTDEIGKVSSRTRSDREMK